MEEFGDYQVTILQCADDDIKALRRWIAEEVFAPATADKYIAGIRSQITSLSFLGASYAISQNPYIQKHYGPNARTIHYKKMTIVYSIAGNVVLVKRVMASSLIR